MNGYFELYGNLMFKIYYIVYKIICFQVLSFCLYMNLFKENRMLKSIQISKFKGNRMLKSIQILKFIGNRII